MGVAFWRFVQRIGKLMSDLTMVDGLKNYWSCTIYQRPTNKKILGSGKKLGKGGKNRPGGGEKKWQAKKGRSKKGR